MEFPTGWTCEATTLRLEQYLSWTLSYTEALCIAEHLEACPECMQRLVVLSAMIVSSGPTRGGPRG